MISLFITVAGIGQSVISTEQFEGRLKSTNGMLVNGLFARERVFRLRAACSGLPKHSPHQSDKPCFRSGRPVENSNLRMNPLFHERRKPFFLLRTLAQALNHLL